MTERETLRQLQRHLAAANLYLLADTVAPAEAEIGAAVELVTRRLEVLDVAVTRRRRRRGVDAA